MHARITTRLLTALLALIACWSVPVATVETRRASQSIVWVDRTRESRRQVEEPRSTAVEARRQTTLLITALDSPLALRFLDYSGFQRPPPSLLVY
jgi:hypothetical protein